MNEIKFVKDNINDFPLNSDTMDFLMSIIRDVAKLSALGGENYILSGCDEEKKGSFKSGYIVVRGELIWFKGGTEQDNCRIVRKPKDSIVVNTTTYEDIEIEFHAEFGDGNGQFAWSSLKRIKTLSELTDMVADFETRIKSIENSFTSFETRIKTIENNYIDKTDSSQTKIGTLTVGQLFKRSAYRPIEINENNEYHGK